MAKKPTRSSLYKEFEKALREHARMSLRAENHKNYIELFIDHKQIGSIQENPDWQIISGRRGSGKTMLLRVMEARLNQEIVSKRVLPIVLGAYEFLVSPIRRTVNEKERALAYFQTFIEQLCEKIVKYSDNLLFNKPFLHQISGMARRKTLEVENKLVQVLEAAERGYPVHAFMDQTYIESTHEGKSQILDTEASLSGELSMTNMSGGVRFGTKAGATEQKLTESTYRREGVTAPRFSRVRERILEVLDLLDIKHLMIIIDEFQALDNTASMEIQPTFTEFLKRTFIGTPRISIKIAGNPYQMRLNNKMPGIEFRGLELNADIFEATNLDHALLSSDSLREFYECLLFKRLSFINPNLGVFDSNNHGMPDPEFLRGIFRNDRAFDELVVGASGLPRDFLIVFNILSRKKEYSVDPSWDVLTVREAIIEQSVAGKQRDIEVRSPAEILMLRCIRPIVTRDGSRLFCIARNDWPRLNDAIEELLERRLVHEWPLQKLESALRNEFHVYSLDYGVCLDWQRSISTGYEIHVPELGSENINSYCLDPNLTEGEFIVCKECRYHFITSVLSFVKRGLCPNCFLPAQ